jgi:hypothetical protein
MAATFGEVLILNLDGTGAGAFQKAHGALDVERVAVAGVGVDDEMSADPVADERDRLHDFVHADEADVGPPEPRIGNAGAGDVQRLEAGAFGNKGGERIVNARRH